MQLFVCLFKCKVFTKRAPRRSSPKLIFSAKPCFTCLVQASLTFHSFLRFLTYAQVVEKSRDYAKNSSTTPRPQKYAMTVSLVLCEKLVHFEQNAANIKVTGHSLCLVTKAIHLSCLWNEKVPIELQGVCLGSCPLISLIRGRELFRSSLHRYMDPISLRLKVY